MERKINIKMTFSTPVNSRNGARLKPGEAGVPCPLVLEVHVRCQMASGWGLCHQSVGWQPSDWVQVMELNPFLSVHGWCQTVFCIHLGMQVSSIFKMVPKAVYGMEPFRVRNHYFMQHKVIKNKTPDTNINTEGLPMGTKSLVLDCESLNTKQGCRCAN